MPDTDRRYERPGAEPPLTLGSRRRSGSPGPTPITLIVSVLLLVIVAGAVFYMYRSGARTPTGVPQPLGAPLGDVRAPPPPQTPNADPGAGLTISKDDPNALSAPPTLAPSPEQPLPRTPAPSPLPPPPPSAKAVPASPAHGAPVLGAPAPGTPAVSTRPRNPGLPAGRPASEKPDAIDGLIARAAKPKPPKAPSDAGDGDVVVQIGAFSSESLADREWSKAAAVAPGAMAGMGKRVVPVTRDGDTLYRTSITGFASRDQAVALCDRLKAAGGVCFVH